MPVSKLLFVFLLTFSGAFAQPGYVDVERNINDLTEHDAYESREWPETYRLTVIIDKKSADFSKLNLLKGHASLVFSIDLPEFPEAFNSVVFDSIKAVYFTCSSRVRDISNIKGFGNASMLSFIGFRGKVLPPALAGFANLKELGLSDAKKLNDISVLPQLKALEWLTLNCTALKTFPAFPGDNRLFNLSLNGVHNRLDFSNLGTLHNLGKVTLEADGALSVFPANLPKGLKQIEVVGNVLSITTINQYPQLRFLRVANTGLKAFDVDLKGADVVNLHLDNNPKMSNISGVYTCAHLEYLYLNGLPELKEFEFGALKLKQGLSLQGTGITKIEPMEALDSLGYLYICSNPYLELTAKPTWPKDWQVSSNGTLLKK